MKKSIIWTFFLTLIFISRYSLADETFTCPVLADVYIDQLSPDENFNAKTRVLIATQTGKGIARGLFLFDIPEDVISEEVVEVTLYLSSSIHTGGGYAIDVNCYALNTPFDENGDTWNSLSGGDYDDSLSSPGSLPSGNDWEISIDVTELVSWNLDKLRDYGMLMRLQNEDVSKDYQNIASRESTDPQDFAPYMEIVCQEITTSSISTSVSSSIPTTTSSTPSTTTTELSSTTSEPSTTTTQVPPLTTTTNPTSSSSTTAFRPCLIEQIYGIDSEEVEFLRIVRDEVLSRTPEGMAIINLYYEWNPVILKIINEDIELNDLIKKTLDDLLQIMITSM